MEEKGWRVRVRVRVGGGVDMEIQIVFLNYSGFHRGTDRLKFFLRAKKNKGIGLW